MRRLPRALAARVAPILLVLWTAAAARADVGRADAARDALPRARAALRNLGYTDARTLLDTALKQGGHPRDELLEIYALRGEAEAVLDGADASETEFRKLLVLDPDHAPPTRDTPTFRVPFDNAKKWVMGVGAFRLEQKTAEAANVLTVTEQVISDPLAMATSVELYYRGDDAAPYTKITTASWQQAIPYRASEARYYFYVLDRFGNTLVNIGTAQHPIRDVTAPPVKLAPRPTTTTTASEPTITATQPVDDTPQPRARPSKAGWGLLGGGVAGAIIGAVLLAESLSAVNAGRDATTRSSYLDDLHRSRVYDGAGGAVLGVGCVLAVVGSALLIHHALKH